MSFCQARDPKQGYRTIFWGNKPENISFTPKQQKLTILPLQTPNIPLNVKYFCKYNTALYANSLYMTHAKNYSNLGVTGVKLGVNIVGIHFYPQINSFEALTQEKAQYPRVEFTRTLTRLLFSIVVFTLTCFFSFSDINCSNTLY